MALWLLIDRERATRGTGTDGRKMKDGKQAKAKGAHLHHLLTSICFLPKDPQTADINGNLNGIKILVDHAKPIKLTRI